MEEYQDKIAEAKKEMQKEKEEAVESVKDFYEKQI